MTFPAWFDFARDAVMLRHPATLAVYAHLLSVPECFFEPQEVRVGELASEYHLARESVIGALSMMVERGYLLDHSRAVGNVRRVSVVLRRRSATLTAGRPKERPQRPNRHISPRLRWRVLERDGHRCKSCGATADTAKLHVDHVVAVARCGTTEEANLQTLCADCNLGKSDTPQVRLA